MTNLDNQQVAPVAPTSNPLINHAAPLIPAENPLLAKARVPGRTFPLPSRGLMYTSELAPSVINGEVHVYPMTAIDEIEIKSADMLFTGNGIRNVIKRCVPSITNPAAMFSADIDALMVYMRMVTYGNEYKIDAIHPCEQSRIIDKDGKKLDAHREQRHVIDLESLVGQMTYLDPTTITDVYTVPLSNGQKVLLTPTRHGDVVQFLQDTIPEAQRSIDEKRELDIDLIKTKLFQELIRLIDNVDGISNPAMIEEWLSTIPAPLTGQIIDRVAHIGNHAMGINIRPTVPCKYCGEHFTFELPLNPTSFFSI